MRHIKLFESSMGGGLKKISIDLAGGGDADDFLQACQEIIEQFNLQIINLWPLGPGGGNPEVTFRGEAQDIMAMVEWYCELAGDSDPQGFYDTYAKDDSPIPFEVQSDSRMSIRDRRHVNTMGKPVF
jgi:hypothetical protein